MFLLRKALVFPLAAMTLGLGCSADEHMKRSSPTAPLPPPTPPPIATRVTLPVDTVKAHAGMGPLVHVLGTITGDTIPVVWTSSDTTLAIITHSERRGSVLSAVVVGKGRAGTITFMATAGASSDSMTVILEDLDSTGLTAVDIAIGGNSGGDYCVIAVDGRPFCLGESRGFGAPIHAWVPVEVVGEVRAAAISVERQRSCAIAVDMAAYCWRSGRPERVAGGQSFRDISIGSDHVCALTVAGAAYCWGQNWGGQLGDGTTVDRNTPVAVHGGVVFASVSAMGNHTCGVSLAGALYCWGSLQEDSAGTSPVQIATVPPLAQISLGHGYSCALTTDGAALCWGGNVAFDMPSAIAFPAGVRLTRVDAGSGHACGLATDGSAYCWGSVDDGEGGGIAFSPTKVSGVRFASVSAGGGSFYGGSQVCGITVDAKLLCWTAHLGHP